MEQVQGQEEEQKEGRSKEEGGEGAGAEDEAAKADRIWVQQLERDSSAITDLFGGQLQVGGPWGWGAAAPRCRDARAAAHWTGCRSLPARWGLPRMAVCAPYLPVKQMSCGPPLQSSVTCHKCGGRFTMYEPFWDLRWASVLRTMFSARFVRFARLLLLPIADHLGSATFTNLKADLGSQTLEHNAET